MQKGCACKFLYGPDTTEEQRARIDKSLESKTELKMEVVFYKQTGKLYAFRDTSIRSNVQTAMPAQARKTFQFF